MFELEAFLSLLFLHLSKNQGQVLAYRYICSVSKLHSTSFVNIFKLGYKVTNRNYTASMIYIARIPQQCRKKP
jgi:hypothetical protein